MSTQRKSARIQLKGWLKIIPTYIRTETRNPTEKQRAECLSEPEAPTTLPSSISVTSNKPPPRPSNSFICYRSWALREGLLKNITSSQVELSKLIGKQWGAMTAAQKRPFVVKARELKAARITALELGSLNVGGHSSNHRVPCEVKTKSTSNSRNENRLQVCN
jgi:hypothetical protein